MSIAEYMLTDELVIDELKARTDSISGAIAGSSAAPSVWKRCRIT